MNRRNKDGMKHFGIQLGKSKPNAFEGWFIKIDDPIHDILISVIWGYATNTQDSHSFIQFQSSIDHQTHYVKYPLDACYWEENPFTLHIGMNQLSEEKMVLDLNTETLRVKGTFYFDTFRPIRRSVLKSNIMGFLSYLPNECNHSIISMYHKVQAQVEINGKRMILQDANGYIEKDWGTHFPKRYVWCQSMNSQGDSLVFSHATVPMLGRFATGFFALLHLHGDEYRFSSIEFSRMLDFHTRAEGFDAYFRKGNTHVQLACTAYNPIPLRAPRAGAMDQFIKESLDGKLELVLKKDGKVNFFKSHRASMDVHWE